ncbi:MAG TPA: shikimate dehydrogenase [Aliidongia sp.]|uniref:shikimate dehydrogenase n=1 Tax=Aliidongia sp. TaxID=1914230 RepID=UPI002DDCBFF8|nr:shikimate dehydrogenase [Aliidongia sp.]HEV2676861.1 shikimate dehydrogenase [Aliidongia sp.]
MSFRLSGVMGWPIGHSRSPALHGHWLKRHDIAGAYVPLAVQPERLEQALRALPALGFAGCNVTVPHKEAAFRLVDHVDRSAARLGAVNTIVVRPDGTLEGRNTDGEGFLRHLEACAPDWRAADRPVLVLGAGGAGRAIVGTLADMGVGEIRVANRTDARAEALAAEFGRPLVAWPWTRRTEGLADCSLVVNTTQLGMVGWPALDLPLDLLPPDGVVNDIVYAPLETALLTDARRRGHIAVDGLGMLLHQARAGFAAWFGIEPVVDEALRQAVLGSMPP